MAPRKKKSFDDVEFLKSDPEGALAAEVKKLRADLKVCREERGEYLAGWQRARADIVNERKALEKRSGRAAYAIREQFVLDLLPALDSFDMAFANKDTWEKVDANWRSGIEHIHAHITSVLAQHGFTPFNPEGERFNPQEHECLESVLAGKEDQDGRIVETLQRGYRHGKTVIRPAKVKVATYGDSKPG